MHRKRREISGNLKTWKYAVHLFRMRDAELKKMWNLKIRKEQDTK